MENQGKETNLNEGMDFKEEIIIEEAPFAFRGNSRTVIGKKKILSKTKLRGAESKPKVKPKQTNAEFLIDTLLKTYWTSKWKEQIIIMKFSRVGYNKKRADFRSLCMKLNHSMKYHQYLFLTKLFDNMEKLPIKSEVKHDDFYGKIKLVSKSDNRVVNENQAKEKNENNNAYKDNMEKVEIKINAPKMVEVEFKPELEQIQENEKASRTTIVLKPKKKLNKLKDRYNKIMKNKDNIINNDENKKENNNKDNINQININNNINKEENNNKNIIINQDENNNKNIIINQDGNNNNQIINQDKKINNNIINQDKNNNNNNNNNIIINQDENKNNNIINQDKNNNNIIINQNENINNNIINQDENKNENKEQKEEIIIEPINYFNNNNIIVLNNDKINNEDDLKVNNDIEKKDINIQEAPKEEEVEVVEHIQVLKNKPLKEKKEVIMEEKKIKPEIIENEEENMENNKVQKISERVKNALTKQLKQIRDNNLEESEKKTGRKTKRHSVINTDPSIKKKEEFQIKDRNEGYNTPKKKRLSHFFEEYNIERIHKSKRLQYKLKNIKSEKEE